MTKEITLYNNSTADIDPPYNLFKHIVWLQSMLASVPLEFHDAVVIKMDADDYCLNYEVSYERPETPNEAADRIQNRVQAEHFFREKELATLAALKAKYPTY